jgi:hypothetical protein
LLAFEPRNKAAAAKSPRGLMAKHSGPSPTTTLSMTRGGLAVISMMLIVSISPSADPAPPLSAVIASLPSGVKSTL